SPRLAFRGDSRAETKTMITRLLLAVSTTVALGGAGDEWKTFTPKAGGFTVSFPGEPTEHKQSVKTPSGSTIEVSLYVDEAKNRLYQTLVIGPPKMVAAKETEQFLNSFKLVK